MSMHWREKQLIDTIQQGKWTTTDIINRVNMSKVTALKYLENLKKRGLVYYEDIGPAKVWFIQTEEKRNSNKIKVLVADDDINIITIISDSLSADQFKILEAHNGKEALGVIVAEKPDVMILDIMMSGMDGYRVCYEIKKSNSSKNIPIIVLSAKTSIEDKLKAMELGIADYMIKPFDPRELEARIKMAMRFNGNET